MPAPIDVDFSKLNAERPVAGQTFEGLAIINRTGLTGFGNQPGAPERFTSVRCDAEVGGKRLHAKQLSYGHPHNDGVQVIVCAWRIPADAAGKKLRLWEYVPQWGSGGAIVRIRNETTGSSWYSWRVTKS